MRKVKSMSKLRIFALSVVVLLMNSVNAEPLKTILIKQETKNSIIDIKYPQGFNDNSIDLTVKKLIENLQSTSSNLANTENLPADIPGKNSLYIDYKITFQTPHVVSLLFNVSRYSRGAAHPNNTVQTLNFIDGKPYELEQLFKHDSDFLNGMANYCKTQLLKMKDGDKKWITTGSSASLENYRFWNFNKRGLSVIFDTYQVAAYVYGPQTVIVPKSLLKSWTQPEVEKAVWGNA